MLHHIVNQEVYSMKRGIGLASLLHHATLDADTTIARLLLENGADTELCNKYCCTLCVR